MTISSGQIALLSAKRSLRVPRHRLFAVFDRRSWNWCKARRDAGVMGFASPQHPLFDPRDAVRVDFSEVDHWSLKG
jgi:hypothetical protein